jgi:ABC-type branched-subunit amino acid transport system substrate-binding protein
MKNVKFTAAALCALAAAGPAFAEIKIGIMVPISGSLATYGIDMENAIRMAAEDINAKGGVLGQKIVTFTADDGCDPQMATAALKATKAYPGLAGPISFDQNNNLAQSNFITLEVKNAKWALVR